MIVRRIARAAPGGCAIGIGNFAPLQVNRTPFPKLSHAWAGSGERVP